MAKRRRRRMPSQRSAVSEHEVYERIASEPDFAELRRRYRRFAFPATVAFMVWYITYVVCNNWARDLMNTQVIGNINIGAGLRAAPVRLHVRHRLPVRALLDEEPGPAGHQAAG